MAGRLGKGAMRIVHVSPLYYPSVGGGELHMKELSEGLASRGHEVTVLTANVRNLWELWRGTFGELPDREIINGVRIVRFHPSGKMLGFLLRKWLQVRGGYRSMQMLFGKDGFEMLMERPLILQLVPFLVRCDADIVMSMNWRWATSYHTHLAGKIRRFPLVGIPLFHTEEKWSERGVYEKMLAACNAVVVNTAHEREFILGRVPTARKVVVAGVGVNTEKFARRDGLAFRVRHALGRGPLIGFVGRMISNKGADKVVEAMHIVWKWKKDVRLILAGGSSYEFPRLDTVLHNLAPNERERVLMFPNFPEEEKASLHDALDVFVLPSTGESFGIAYLEAWMCHKAVVGSRIGSTSCVIQEGADGLLVDPNDPGNIASAIIELLADPDKRTRMGERGYAKTINHFTWDKVTDRVERLYLDLVAETLTPRSRPLSCRQLPVGTPPVLSTRTHGPRGDEDVRICRESHSST